MTSRERLLTVLRGEIPDCVPVSPDFSNMIPARLTGKPFWDLYLYNDPPIWEAYIDCAKHFDIDAVMDGYFPLHFGQTPEPVDPKAATWARYIVFRNDERIVTRGCWEKKGERIWNDTVAVYYVATPPTWGVKPETIGLPSEPKQFWPVEGVKPVNEGPEGFKRVMDMMGDQGLVGDWLTNSCALGNEQAIYD